MGKYSLALLQSIFSQKQSAYDDVFIIFTKAMPLEAAAKKRIVQAVPDAELIFADLKVPFDSTLANIPEIQGQNRAVLDTLIAQNSQPQDETTFLILSLFIEQDCSTFPTASKKVLLFYDLIPLQYNELYGRLTSYPNYLARYKTIFEADTLLTISQTVADDIVLNLGISADKIANIDGAPIERSSKTSAKPAVKLPERYILMPSGDELRKNNTRAVIGFEEYLRDHPEDDIALVITSSFREEAQKALAEHSPHSIFTGNVSEQELRWLYENSEAVLFVSEYEGLGLPILEAAEVSKPIVCSDLMVFNEISPTAFYYSDPFDPFSIATAIDEAISGTKFAAKLKQYPAILKKYTWANTAAKALAAMTRSDDSPKVDTKLRLAILSPSPGGYSAVGKLVMQLHPSMNEYFDIDYYVEYGDKNKLSRPDYLPYIANVLPAADFNRKRYRQYDAVLYHIGNSEFHLESIKNALYLPGYAIFHDAHLSGIFEVLARGYMTPNRLEAERQLDTAIANPDTSYLASIVNNQKALIAHSNHTESALRRTSLESNPITPKLNLPTAVPAQVLPKKSKQQMSIGLAGIIHPAKGLDIIEAIAQSSELYDIKIHIFGLSLVPEEKIRQLQSYPNVQVDTNLTDFQFQMLLSQLDVLINFRSEYKGETSMATIEAMRFGVIPLVRKVGWYDELPDDCVVKVDSASNVITELKALLDNTERRIKMKLAARDFIKNHNSYQVYAKDLHDLISNPDRSSAKVNQVADALRGGASQRSVRQLWQRAD